LVEIEQMTQSIYDAMLNSSNMMKSIKNLPTITKKITDPKRQTLGNTTSLPKISFTLIFIALLGYALILTGPIVNKLYTTRYIKETQYLLYNKSNSLMVYLKTIETPETCSGFGLF